MKNLLIAQLLTIVIRYLSLSILLFIFINDILSWGRGGMNLGIIPHCGEKYHYTPASWSMGNNLFEYVGYVEIMCIFSHPSSILFFLNKHIFQLPDFCKLIERCG